MTDDICPSLFYIVPDATAIPYNDDIFRPDRFKILLAESLTRVKEIVVNTGTNEPLQIRLLCCYQAKALPVNYCAHRHVEHPKKQLCDKNSGIRNNFTHFHLKKEKPDTNEYLLAFIEGADLYDNIDILIKELVRSATWLEIPSAGRIYFIIFTFGEPTFSTRNISYLDSCINTAKNNLLYGYTDVYYDILHICRDFENRLTISMRDNKLSFASS
jgi:hypothetical protein